MTSESNHKLRAVFLAALMVLWVFAGAVAFTGSAAAQQSQINVDDNADRDIGTYWQGQELNLTGDAGTWNDGVEYDLRQVDDDDELSSAVREIRAGANQITVRTGALDDGVYALETEQSSDFRRGSDVNRTDDVVFEIRVQDFDVEFDDDEVRSGGTTDIEIDSNRAGYNVTVTADGLDEDELEDIFRNFDTEVEDDDEIRLNDLSSFEEVEVDFDDIDAGDYDFEFEVDDTSAEASASITVLEELDEEYRFTQAQFNQERGDIAEFTIELEGADDPFEVQVGDDDIGYEALIVVDPDGEDEVTIQMNTFAAGNATGLASDEADAYDIDSPDDDASIDSVTLNTDDLDSVLEPGLYDLSVGVDLPDEESDVSTLNLEERSTNEMTLWTAPNQISASDLDEPEELWAEIDDERVTETDTIAIADDRDGPDRGDYLIHAIDISGVYGAVDAAEIDNGTELVDTGYFDIELEQQNPTANRPARTLNESSLDHFDVIADDQNNTLFVVVDSDDLEFDRGGDTWGASEVVGDEYEVDVTVNHTYLQEFTRDTLDEDDDESLTAEFELVDRELNFDTEGDDIRVEPAEGQVISGDTTVAPGTEFTIRARSTGEVSFLKTAPDTVVNADHEFSGEFDFSDVAAGTEFTASVRSQSFEDNAETDGVVVDADAAFFEVSDLDPQDVTVDQGDAIDVSATITNTGGQEDTQTVEFRVNGDTIDSEEVTLDADEDATVEFTGIDTADLEPGDYEHGVFSEDDSQTATLTVEGEPDEDTPDQDTPDEDTPDEDTPDEDTPDQDTPDPDDQIGFGAVLALLAVLGAALLAARRNAFDN